MKFSVALFCLLLSACGSDEKAVEDYTGPELDCAGIDAKALDVLDTYCSGCHQAPANQGNMNYILSESALLSNGKIDAGSPDTSPIYKRMKNGSMPPASVQNRPEPVDIETVKTWINCL